MRQQMQWVLQLFGRRLVRLQRPFCVALQINMHFSDRIDVATLRVIGEFVAIYLVVAIMGAAIDYYVHVAQIGAIAGLELHRLGGSNGVQTASAFGLGQRKAIACLLNIDSQFRRHAVQGGNNSKTGKPIGNRNADNEDNDARYQPLADLSYGLKHLLSILRQPAQVSQSSERKIVASMR